MRPSMLPGLLSGTLFNSNRGQKNIKIFEIGKIYTVDGEKDAVGIILTGLQAEDWRQTDKQNADYYDLKGAVEKILLRKGSKEEEMDFVRTDDKCFVDGQAACVIVNGKNTGILGKLDDHVLRQWDIKLNGVYYAQIELDAVDQKRNAEQKYQPVPEFPAIVRDISLAVKKNIMAQDVTQLIRRTARQSKDVVLSDIKFAELYEGEKIASGRRGLIFSMTYRSRLARTLRDDEVQEVHKKVCDALISELGAIQR